MRLRDHKKFDGLNTKILKNAFQSFLENAFNCTCKRENLKMSYLKLQAINFDTAQIFSISATKK